MLWPALNEWETDRSSGQKTFRGTWKIQRLFALPRNNAATTETQMDWLFSWGNVTHCGSWRKDDRGELFQIKPCYDEPDKRIIINCQNRHCCYNGTIPRFISYNCWQTSFFCFLSTVIVKSACWRASCTFNRATMTKCFNTSQIRLLHAVQTNFVLFIFLHPVTWAGEK